MLQELLQRARAGEPLWLPDVREAFRNAADAVPLTLRLTRWDGGTRDYAHRLPRWRDEEERRLVRDYLRASVFNLLSVCGGRELRFFFDLRDAETAALVAEMDEAFQRNVPERHGPGRVVNIAERMGRAFGGDFSFAVSDTGEYTPCPRRRSGSRRSWRQRCCASAGRRKR